MLGEHFIDFADNQFIKQIEECEDSEIEKLVKEFYKGKTPFDIIPTLVKLDDNLFLKVINVLADNYKDFSYIVPMVDDTYSISNFKKLIIATFKNNNLDMEDYQYLISNGYKCNSKTKICNRDMLFIFIDNGQPDVIEHTTFPVMLDVFIYALRNGYKFKSNSNVAFFSIDIFNYCLKNGIYDFIIPYLFENSVYHSELPYDDFFNSIKGYVKENTFEEFLKNNNLYDEFTKLFIVKYDGNFDMFHENLIDGIIEYYKDNPIITSYLRYTIDNNLNLCGFIDSIDKVYLYFDKDGPSKEFYNFVLFDYEYISIIFKDNKTYNLDKNLLNYVTFCKNIKGCLTEIIDNVDDIYEYFDENGPKDNFFEKILFDDAIVEVFIKHDYTKFHTFDDSVKSYIEFAKSIYEVNGDTYYFMELFNYIESYDDIHKYFDSNGITFEFVRDILDSEDLVYLVDDNYFKEYYELYYKNNDTERLLSKLNFDYRHLCIFLNSIVDGIQLPLENVDGFEKELYSQFIDYSDDELFIKIMKYIFFNQDGDNVDLHESFVNIVHNGDYYKLMTVYKMNYDELDFNILINMIQNFEYNKKLYDILLSLTSIPNDLKYKVKFILEDKNRMVSINSLSDIININKILYNEGLKQISINPSIYLNKYFLGEDIKSFVERLPVTQYLRSLRDEMANIYAIQLVDEYIELIKLIRFSDVGEKRVAYILNNLYEEDRFEELYEFKRLLLGIPNSCLDLCKEEIEEKLIDYDSLLKTNDDEIPCDNKGEKLFINSSVEVNEPFVYGGVQLDSGTKVDMIELNGIPFVSLVHVLNAFGTGGKLSEFIHPRNVGSVHISLSAIDDCFYETAGTLDYLAFRKSRIADIDGVRLLFSDIKNSSLAYASDEDISSFSEYNSLSIGSSKIGNCKPVRENISCTRDEYNEYTFYRNGLLPSAILIRDEIPSDAEIDAAAYLSKVLGKSIPLVKINREKYPPRSIDEKFQIDYELGEYYRSIYKADELRNEKYKMQLEKIRNIMTNIRGMISDNSKINSI